MKFGIYPGSATGTDTGLATGKPDDPVLINKAFDEMEKKGVSIIVRGYIQYLGDTELDFETPENLIQYSTQKRKIDLVICYRAKEYNKEDWTNTIRILIQQYGERLCSIQITEEPNLKIVFAADGSFDNIEKALLDGVLAAKTEITKFQYDIKVGFNAVPSFNPADNFWNIIGGDDYLYFRKAIDYVGLDFYPDVFRPVAEDGQPNDLAESVKNVLQYFRNVNLQTGKISASIPIHITENGWSTGNNKTHERQANVIEKIIRTINKLKRELNIAQYEFFNLRDTDSNNPDIFYQFGMLKDDYSPKPCYNVFCQMIIEYGE
jgi:hypothetical protein